LEKEYQQKLESYESQLKEFETKESSLLHEMKKKSETARQLLLSKDKEIDQLKAKLAEKSKPAASHADEPTVQENDHHQVNVPPRVRTPSKDFHGESSSYPTSTSGSSLHADVPSTPSHATTASSSLKVDDILSLEEVRLFDSFFLFHFFFTNRIFISLLKKKYRNELSVN
jgi:hypothetical protein